MTPRGRWQAVLLGHDIQPITPTANILALYEVVADCGRRG